MLVESHPRDSSGDKSGWQQIFWRVQSEGNCRQQVQAHIGREAGNGTREQREGVMQASLQLAHKSNHRKEAVQTCLAPLGRALQMATADDDRELHA